MRYKIEKNIPLPEAGKTNSKYAVIGDMEVGDSIFMEGKIVTSVSCILKKYKKSGKAFSSRTVEGGVRTWRIK
ncbi:MAG: hypothetical protein JNK14_13815 [Chitinophagaceae bacterium]|nr:hypothetical protein [Chitinophagaceae bacterium]